MKHRLILLALSSVFLISMVGGVFPQHANAADDYSYTDNSNVAIQGTNPFATADQSSTVTYQKVADTSKWYGFAHGIYLDLGSPENNNAGGTCYPAIQTASKQYDGSTSGKVYLECGDKGHSDPKGAKSITIQANKGNPGSQAAQTECKDKPGYEYTACVAGYDGAVAGKSQDDSCKSFTGPANTDACQSAWADGQTAASGDNIDANCPVNVLSWITCPIVDLFSSTINSLDGLITSQLSVGSPGNSDDPNQIFCNHNTSADSVDACQAYHQAWSAFRTIALGLLVVAGLVIIISEMSGLEFFDAYTVRKVLPRLIIAAITITLSWQLMQFFVALSNAAGFGIRFMIYKPFLAAGFSQATLSGGSAALITGIGVGAGAFLGIVGLLSFLGTAGMAVLIAFMVLLLRQMVIIILVIIAPIAIALFILPNTQNLYKLWWDSFAKALMMFPLIAALIATGRVFAAVATHSNTGVFNNVLGFAAYFAPYFLIPLTFRFAGGALRGIGGFVNDRGRGAFNGLSNFRKQKTAQNWDAIQNNRRFNANRGGALGYIAKKTNTGLSNMASPGAAAKIYGGMALNKAGIKNSLGHGTLSQISQSKMEHSQKLAQKLNGMGFNDKALTSLMHMEDHSAGAIRRKAEQLEASANPNERLAGEQLRRHGAFLSQELMKDPEMGKANIPVAAGLAVTAQGFGSTQDIAAVANSREVAGTGMAAAFVAESQLNGARAGRIDMKPGYGVQMGEDGKYFGTGVQYDDSGNVMEYKSTQERDRATSHQIKRILTTGQQELQGAKGGAVKAMAPGFQQLLETKGPTDADGNYSFSFQNEHGVQEEVKYTPADVKRVSAMLGTAQSDYSGTAAATSAEIDTIIGSSDMHPEVQAAYQGARRQTDDPARRVPGDPPEPPSGQNAPDGNSV